MYKKMKLKGVARIEPDHLGDPLEGGSGEGTARQI